MFKKCPKILKYIEENQVGGLEMLLEIDFTVQSILLKNSIRKKE